jgi:hypothetical protein
MKKQEDVNEQLIKRQYSKKLNPLFDSFERPFAPLRAPSRCFAGLLDDKALGEARSLRPLQTSRAGARQLHRERAALSR